MPTVIQKFGGTSLVNREAVVRCARRIATRHEHGDRVVVVVSAMGETTDRLVEQGRMMNPDGNRREFDLLMAAGEQVSAALMALALESLGVGATALTGAQAGFMTDEVHGRARIKDIRTSRLASELDADRVPVVMGFQGVTNEGELTTFGRGGSDTTAVALAAALNVAAEGGYCEINTDVAGIHTADPRLIAEARRLDQISYEEMLELALHGARVMDPRALVFGEKYSVPILVRHSTRPGAGTLITSMEEDMERPSVVGCALKEDIGRIALSVPAGESGAQAAIFEATARAGIVVDDIIQTEHDGRVHVAFTVEHADLAVVRTAISESLDDLGGGHTDPEVEIGLAKVSAVGTGMKTHTGIASRMFGALADRSIPIRNITTSEIKISCLVPQEHGVRALEAVHQCFDLGMPATENAREG
ncbi:MAG: aspartate kinase [Phycisphaerales bacterium]|nr:aspartate kinase [Phycisphaerales bacterium]